MLSEIKLGEVPFYGTRFLGRGLRERLEVLLSSDGEIRVDFAHAGVTQSFLDEFLGVLVVSVGQPLVDRLIFAGCTRETRALLEFVIGARLSDRAHLSSKNRTSNLHIAKSGIC